MIVRTAAGITGVSAICRGWGYWDMLGDPGGPRINGVVKVLTVEGAIPISIHAAAWMLVGAALLYTAATRHRSHGTFTALLAMSTIWALAYLTGWAMGEDPSGWIAAGTYASIAALAALAARYARLLDAVTDRRG